MNFAQVVPYFLPVLPAIVEALSGLLVERLPSRIRPVVPLAIGAALGAAGAALGLSPEMTAAVFGIGGPGAVAWHRFVQGGGRAVQVTPTDSREVKPADLPPK